MSLLGGHKRYIHVAGQTYNIVHINLEKNVTPILPAPSEL